MVVEQSREPNLKSVLSVLDVEKLACKVAFSALPELVLVVGDKGVLFLTVVKHVMVKV
jgi:hypothetical protein